MDEKNPPNQKKNEKRDETPAASSDATARLSQLEQDVAAKQSARGSGGMVASRPGVTAVPSMQRSSGLSQLEQDIAAKTRVTTSSLTQLERDIATKTQASMGMTSNKTEATEAVAPKHLSQLEQDIAAKVQARSGGVAASRPGVVSSSQGLSQLEQDIAAKSNAFSATAPPTTALNQLEQDLQAKQHAASFRGPPPASTATLQNLEDDVLAKQNAYASGPPSRAAAPAAAMASPPSSASYYNAARPPTDPYSHSNNAYDPYNSHRSSNDHPVMGYNDAPAPMLRSSQVPNEYRTTTSYAPGVSPEDLHYQDDDHPEAPLSSYAAGTSLDDDLPASGIEAFVADHVVDATSVAVIMTDEEEEVEVKKRQRKLMIRMAALVVVVLVAVIVPVALLTGGDVAITPAPTLSPTASPTLSPTVAELPQLVDALDLAGVSELSALQNRQSPQGLAVDWIVNDDVYSKEQGLFSLSVRDNVRFLQRYVLAVFYFAMSGDAWGVCHRADTSCSASGEVNGWLTNSDLCTWFVVTCDDQGLITAIDFQDSSQDDNFSGKITPLKGTMPAEIAQLTSLERLIISEMDVQGQLLGYLKNMVNLYYLSVPFNNFTGSIPETFASDHPNLSLCDLSHNQITGAIPTSVGTFQNLDTLTLSSNLLKGELPSELASIPTLQFLDLESNHITGEIPLEFYSSNLLKLRLTGNPLKGSIPANIADMVNLTEFTVGSSDMSGPIPSELFTLQTLKVLDLHNASFTGPLSETGFSNLTSLVYWEVQDNDFTGAIPFAATLLMTNLERFQVQGNDQLTGTVPEEFCDTRGTKPTELQVVFVGCNVQCKPGCCDKNPACVR